MDAQNTTVRPHAPSRNRGKNRPSGGTHDARRPGGVVHDNVRLTARFTVISNDLLQHPGLTLAAIALGAHIQSLPVGAQVDIATLATRFPDGKTRIAAGLRELEAHGYLRRSRERLPCGRIVTRTVSCNQPGRTRPDTPPPPPSEPCPDQGPQAERDSGPDEGFRPEVDLPEVDFSEAGLSEADFSAAPEPGSDDSPGPDREPRSDESPGRGQRPAPDRGPRPASSGGRHGGTRPRRRALPAVPQPFFPAAALLELALGVVAALRREDPRLLVSAAEAEHLAPGVAAWIERDLAPHEVLRALTHDLPAEPLHRPAALIAHRLADRLPPLPAPGRTPPAARHPLQNCDRCDHAYRAPEPGICDGCARTP
ncbi:helix-turn-helix domain-containing protein [Streptomyces sp. CC208A]|uniref:helix-turn-helix domain-containing protein n=1 Tax=Streptomyces sp. CC208A TaxID=3044573 RepID=UPI0024A818FA|nr:helix-turn-helix domain-containing protein [Streptomyces sp. CC208A]